MDQLVYFILVPMVYLSIGVFVIGTVVRLVKIFSQPKNVSYNLTISLKLRGNKRR